MRAKLISVFFIIKVILRILLAAIAWRQVFNLGEISREIVVSEIATALNDSAVENNEHMSMDTERRADIFFYYIFIRSKCIFFDFSGNTKNFVIIVYNCSINFLK